MRQPSNKALRHVPTTWRWPDFTRAELACKHCGEFYDWPEFMDALQALRDLAGRPIFILSGHRCGLHNARIGGAPLSGHLSLAVDIDLRGHNRRELVKLARKAGFKGFGYYENFLHLDMGRARFWYGSKRAKILWE